MACEMTRALHNGCSRSAFIGGHINILPTWTLDETTLWKKMFLKESIFLVVLDTLGYKRSEIPFKPRVL